MSLRAELLAAAVVERDRVLGQLVAQSAGRCTCAGRRRSDGLCDRCRRRQLLAVARREWGVIVGKLAGGGPYRVTRAELPSTHREHRAGSADVLVLVGDELRAVA